MTLNEDGIPEDLDLTALATLDRFAQPVQAFVRRVNRIHWLARAGVLESWDEKVVRVWDLAGAKQAYHTFLPLANTVWLAQGEIGTAAGRSDLLQAAEDYWIARFQPRFDDHEPPYASELLFAAVRSDIVGALREIVLDDIVPIRFYREAITWYEKGHWRAAITSDGKRVVY